LLYLNCGFDLNGYTPLTLAFNIWPAGNIQPVIGMIYIYLTYFLIMAKPINKFLYFYKSYEKVV